MTRTILVQGAPHLDDDSPDANRGLAVAVLEDRVLVDFAASPLAHETRPAPGSIAVARVERVLPGGRGAFAVIENGMGIPVFMKEPGRYRGGESLPVMVTGYAEPGKAAPVTRRPLIKHRHTILIPGAPSDNSSISLARAIPASEREALAPAVDRVAQLLEARLPGAGAILRTYAARVTEDQLLAELGEAIDEWRSFEGGEKTHTEGAFIGDGFARGGPCRSVLDHWATGVAGVEILFDGPGASERISQFAKSPAFADLHGRLLLFDHGGKAEKSGADAFDAFQVREQLRRTVGETALPSGGSIAVESTRAFVAADVNSKGNFSDGSAMTANIEACRDLPRILRLRGLGGQIVVDFAPLRKAHRRKIEEVLKAAFRKCPVETTLAGWTPLGCFELQRKRERLPI